MNIDELKVRELKSLVSSLQGTKKKRKQITDGKIRIVVLQRGWVYVGRYFQDGDNCWLTNAACIRKWGTTKGLNELVDGPTKDTVLDLTPMSVRFNELTVCFTLDVVEAKWQKHLVLV